PHVARRALPAAPTRRSSDLLANTDRVRGQCPRLRRRLRVRCGGGGVGGVRVGAEVARGVGGADTVAVGGGGADTGVFVGGAGAGAGGDTGELRSLTDLVWRL